MVSGCIKKDGLSKSKVDPYGIHDMRVKANSVLCVQCGEWVHGRCAGVEWMSQGFSTNFACMKCDGYIGEAVDQEDIP